MNNIQDWLTQFHQLNPDEEQFSEEGKTYKNDMFKEVLPAIDCGDKTFYNKRTSEQKQELAKNMWMTMRYMSSSQSYTELHIMMVNDLVNVDFGTFVRKVR